MEPGFKPLAPERLQSTMALYVPSYSYTSQLLYKMGSRLSGETEAYNMSRIMQLIKWQSWDLKLCLSVSAVLTHSSVLKCMFL